MAQPITYAVMRIRGLYSVVTIGKSLAESQALKYTWVELEAYGMTLVGLTTRREEAEMVLKQHHKNGIVENTQKIRIGMKPIGYDHKNEMVIVVYMGKIRLWPLHLVVAMARSQNRFRNRNGDIPSKYFKIHMEIEIDTNPADENFHNFMQVMMNSFLRFEEESPNKPASEIKIYPRFTNTEPLFQNGDSLFFFPTDQEINQLPPSFFQIPPIITVPMNRFMEREITSYLNKWFRKAAKFEQKRWDHIKNGYEISNIVGSGHPDWVPESVE